MYECLACFQFWSCIHWVEQSVNLNILNVEFGQKFASYTSGKTVTNRISHSEVVSKNAILKRFGIFKGRHLCWCRFLHKVAGCGSAVLCNKNSGTCFPCEFCGTHHRTHLVYNN